MPTLPVAPIAGHGAPPANPAEDEGGHQLDAFGRGLRVGREIPAFILACTGAGFGALAHDAGVSEGQALFMSVAL